MHPSIVVATWKASPRFRASHDLPPFDEPRSPPRLGRHFSRRTGWDKHVSPPPPTHALAAYLVRNIGHSWKLMETKQMQEIPLWGEVWRVWHRNLEEIEYLEKKKSCWLPHTCFADLLIGWHAWIFHHPKWHIPYQVQYFCGPLPLNKAWMTLTLLIRGRWGSTPPLWIKLPQPGNRVCQSPIQDTSGGG